MAMVIEKFKDPALIAVVVIHQAAPYFMRLPLAGVRPTDFKIPLNSVIVVLSMSRILLNHAFRSYRLSGKMNTFTPEDSWVVVISI